MEQDPMFAFRIVVDIALKALSPAINDPTTAVLAIDQLHRLLRLVGRRSLRNHEVLDVAGQPASCFARRTGRISCISRSGRYASMERTACKSRGDCAR